MSEPKADSPHLTEQALRESEEKFRAVFDQSPIPIALTTLPDGRVAEGNPAAAAFFGFRRGEAIGRTTVELNMWVDPADRVRYLDLLRAQGTVTGYEGRMRRRDGRIATVLCNGCVVRIGGRDYLLSSLLDITERKQAEEARDRSLSLMLATLESTADGILVVDTKGQVEIFNRIFAQMWRLPDEVLAVRDDARLLDCVLDQLSEPQQFLEKVKYLYGHPEEESFDTLMFKDRRVFERYSRPQLIGGKVAGRVWSFRDITERAQLEEQLRQAQKMEALGTLAGGIAHDFNNLLTAIFGHAELAGLALPPSHPAAPHLAAIRDAGLRSRELVNQILTFSRRSETARRPILLQAVLEDSFQFLRSTIPAPVRIDRAINPECPPVLGDATQIHQIVLNLGTNAWHALPEPGGRIELRLEPCTVGPDPAPELKGLASGPYVRLSVTDNGHGMDAATIARIYDPFFTTKPVGKGTGLGLSMVHGIVKAHEGVIMVRSEPGRGTTFEIYFPALPAGVDSVPAPGTAATRGRGERILYVDDDELVALTITELLTRMGYRIEHRDQPREALELFKAAPQAWDLVITDLAMPGMPGTELAAEVARIRPGIPVLLITGYLDRAHDGPVRCAGVREVLRKPLSLEELSGAVQRALS